MVDAFSNVSDRLHSKSHDYFLFAIDRWDRTKRNLFYGATDALLDGSQAAGSYGSAISSNIGANLLACYGFLQALYIQQDAVRTLSQALELSWTPNSDSRLREIRDARNRLCGHPSLAGEREKPRRLSSAIIPYHSISRRGFSGHLYYEDGSETIDVDVATFQTDNEQRLIQQMLLVEKTMDDQERRFRAEQATRPFSSLFEKSFGYLLERLHCDLSDENRVPQAEAHAQMIRKNMKVLENELMERGFATEATLLKVIFTGLDLLEEMLRKSARTEKAQHQFDLIYAGLEKEIISLQTSIGALDTRLASIP